MPFCVCVRSTGGTTLIGGVEDGRIKTVRFCDNATENLRRFAYNRDKEQKIKSSKNRNFIKRAIYQK